MPYEITMLAQSPDDAERTHDASSTFAARPGPPADLVVVGAGLSGLASAYFYQRRFGAHARIVIVDAARQIGGMTRRLELNVDGHTVVTNGGAAAFAGMESWTSGATANVLRELDLVATKSGTSSDREFESSNELGGCIYLQHMGQRPRALVDAGPLLAPFEPKQATAFRSAIAGLPFDDFTRSELLGLWLGTSTLAPNSADALRGKLSYRTFLTDCVGLSPQAADVLDRRPIGTFGSPSACVPAFDALAAGFPGSAFADRLGVHPYRWITDSSLGYEDGLATVSAALLSRISQNAKHNDGRVELVLGHRVVDLFNRDDCVVAQVEGQRASFEVVGSAAVFAGSSQQMARAVRELSHPVRCILERVVKPPMCYVAVGIRDWRVLADASIRQVWSPDAFFYDITLRAPHGANPDRPAALELVYRPIADLPTDDYRVEARTASAALVATDVEVFRQHINNQLDGVLGRFGFDPDRDIAEAVVNSWPHTYSPVLNTLVDDAATFQREMEVSRQPIGRIAVAGADSHRFGWAQATFDAGERAVNDLPSGAPQAFFR